MSKLIWNNYNKLINNDKFGKGLFNSYTNALLKLDENLWNCSLTLYQTTAKLTFFFLGQCNMTNKCIVIILSTLISLRRPKIVSFSKSLKAQQSFLPLG